MKQFLEEESWRWVGQNPTYAISDLGRVYNTDQDHYLKTDLNSAGYERVTLIINNRPKKLFIVWWQKLLSDNQKVKLWSTTSMVTNATT